jgi:hypothetical protein
MKIDTSSPAQQKEMSYVLQDLTTTTTMFDHRQKQ